MAAFKPITVNTDPAAEPHIYAEDDAAIYQSIFGSDGVMMIGQKCASQVISNNKVRVKDGVIVNGGHIARIPYGSYVDCEIANGQSGVNRNDIIMAKFVTTGSGGIDTYTCEVKQGVAGSTASDPALTQNNLYQSGKIREMPLYRVKLEGISIVAVEQMFELIPTIPDLEERIADLNGKITTPTALISRDITVSDRGKRVALTGKLSDYSEIEIRYTFNAYGHFIQSMRMPVKLLNGWSTSPDILNGLFNPYGNGWVIAFVFDDTGITIDASETTDANWAIKGIYGWK